MVRRSFRLGLRLGLLGGAGLAVLKVLQARRDEREQEAALRSTEPWPPVTRAPARTGVEQARPSPATEAAPAAPAAPAAAASSPAASSPSAPTGTAAEAAPASRAEAAWVDPEGRVCPPSHPIKGKLKSRLFHAPGMFAYDRTIPDRCYASEDEAAADGLSRARR
jgi:hypothetical protein